MNSSIQHRFAIVGGGISGLAAAQRILERHPSASLTLFDEALRLGGIIQSTRRDDFLFEHAADSFIVSPELPWAGELCEKLSVDLIEPSATHRGASILRNGKLHPVPTGLQLMMLHQMGPLLRSPLLSWPGKLRVLAERFVPRKNGGHEESLAQFTRRRYGREMFERIVQPLVSGIYTADPERLSMSAALPQFVKQEQEHGSLLRAAKHARRDRDAQGARYGLFRSPILGMQSLIDTIESYLREKRVDIRLSTQVSSVEREGERWRVCCSDQTSEEFDGVVVATSTKAVPDLVAAMSQKIASSTEKVEHVGTAVLCIGYRTDQLERPLTSFGSVVPFVEKRKVLAISHTSVKFPDRAPVGHCLLRAFVGGALQPQMLDLNDQVLLSCVTDELAKIMGIRGDPVIHQIVRWPKTTPQYNLGHREVVTAIRAAVAELPAFEFTSNALDGVGIPQCIRGGWQAADNLLEGFA